MSKASFAAALIAIWVLAWGSASPANLLSGLAVAGLLLALAPDTWPRRRSLRLRPVAIVRFTAYALVQVLLSNIVIAREVLVRRPRLHTGVIAVPLPDSSDEVMTLISNIMALSPGLMPIELDRDPTVLYVHVLHVDDLEASRRQVERLAELAYRAFGSNVAIDDLDRHIETGGPAVTKDERSDP